MSKKRITPWIDESLTKEFDALDGKLSENLEAAMQLYLRHETGEEVNKENNNSHELKALQIEIVHKEELIESKEDRIRDLQVQLGWLQMELSKTTNIVQALPPAKKRWKWQFWKRKRE